MNYLLAVLAISCGSFFGLHPESEALMQITSLGVAVIALLYLLLRGKRDLDKRREATISGWDNPYKSRLSKHIDER